MTDDRARKIAALAQLFWDELSFTKKVMAKNILPPDLIALLSLPKDSTEDPLAK